MRLAIVAGHTWTTHDAGDRLVADQATALVRSGHQVHVFVPDRNGRTRARTTTHIADTEVPVVAVPATGEPSAAAYGAGLAAAWQRWRPDLVHAHQRLGGDASLAAVEQVRSPVVLTCDEPPTGTATAWQRALGERVARVITRTRAETDQLVRAGLARQRMTLVPAGVDTGLFTPDGDRMPRGPGLRVLSVASAAEWDDPRGIADVIRALARLPSVELVLIGGTPGPDGGASPQAARLVRLAAHHGIDDRVRLVGPAPYEDMPRWYRSADLVVCPSRQVSLGMTALEAMACSVPVVATAVGAHRDAVVDGLTGVLVPPGEPRALALALRKLLSDPIRRMAYAAAARDRAQQCYAWERVVRFLAGAYRQACPPAHDAPEWDIEPVTRTASA